VPLSDLTRRLVPRLALVLLDDNFATIVAAIEQGRTTFANARRFLTYHLTDNVAELTPFLVWALSGGRFPLALGVLQVLCLDIGTDILPAVALGAEPSSRRALAQPPLGRHLVDRALLVRALLVLGLTESIVEMVAYLATLWSMGWRPGAPFPSGAPLLAASGAAFTARCSRANGQCLRVPKCGCFAATPWLVLELVSGRRRALRATDVGRVPLSSVSVEPAGASTAERSGLHRGSACDSSSPRRRRDTQTAARTIEFAPLNHSCGPP